MNKFLKFIFKCACYLLAIYACVVIDSMFPDFFKLVGLLMGGLFLFYCLDKWIRNLIAEAKKK